MRGGFSCIFALVISPLGHRGHLPWGNLDISLNRKGVPVKVALIGHPLLRQSCIHLPWALGKYRLCDNRNDLIEEFIHRYIHIGLEIFLKLTDMNVFQDWMIQGMIEACLM